MEGNHLEERLLIHWIWLINLKENHLLDLHRKNKKKKRRKELMKMFK